MSKTEFLLLVIAGSIIAGFVDEIAVKPIVNKLMGPILAGLQSASAYAAGPPPDGL